MADSSAKEIPDESNLKRIAAVLHRHQIEFLVIRIKEHIDRAKDRESLLQLLAIRRPRNEGKTTD
jgi:hypothetical protein